MTLHFMVLGGLVSARYTTGTYKADSLINRSIIEQPTSPTATYS